MTATMSEADRADAALKVIVSDPCACPERHSGTPDGTCRNRSAEALEHAGTVLAVCIPCTRSLLDVQFLVPPGRASGSASWYRRTG
jgi:hypothetical protein